MIVATDRGDHDHKPVRSALSANQHPCCDSDQIERIECETAEGIVYDEKDVTSPFPFLDLAAKLIMQLADAD